MADEIALSNQILRGVVGSTAYGTAIEGQSDRDEMGVFVEPPELVFWLGECDHYVQRDRPEGVRSQPGDLDLTLYSLRKFVRLAVQGDAGVILLLWLPEHKIKTPLGAKLVELRDAFVSKEMGMRFLGYLISQKKKLRSGSPRTVQQQELIGRFGYDTKFAMHALRLGYEGIELMKHRRITLPMQEPNLSTLRAVRSGEIGRLRVLRLIEKAETRLRGLIDDCQWTADVRRIHKFLVGAHIEYWNCGISLNCLANTADRLASAG